MSLLSMIVPRGFAGAISGQLFFSVEFSFDFLFIPENIEVRMLRLNISLKPFCKG
jgi:hypothetical protein